MRTSDAVIAIAGALTIGIALYGVITIESRAGPFEHALEPVAPDGQASGTFRTTAATGTRLDGGTCVPDPPANACTAARYDLELRIEGLPRIDPALHYLVFLMAGEGAHPAGPLVPTEDAHVLVHGEDTDGSRFSGLVVGIGADAAASRPGDLVVFTQTINPERTDDVSLSGPLQAPLEEARGEVWLGQTGAVTVSTLTDLTVEGIPPEPGVVFHAWLESEKEGPIYLGSLERQEDGTHTLDSRIERVRLADQDRFLVTLAADGADAQEQPGLPVLDAIL